MGEGERTLRFGFKDPNQHLESLTYTGDFDKELVIADS